MILMGDEIGRSQGGNNNSWCQNNLLGWMNWEHARQDLELLEYFKYVIKIRKKLINIFNPPYFPNNQTNENIPTYHWHGTKLDNPIGVVGLTQLPLALTKAILIRWSG